MIPRTLNAVEDSHWKTILSNSNISLKQLCNQLEIPYDKLAESAYADFPLRVPAPYLRKIAIGDPNDPLLLQILPQASELAVTPGFSHDPLQEAQHNPVPGIIHKYQNRVLLIQSGTCAINCRYCFRRHFPYAEQRQSKKEWEETLGYIKSDKQINEVILSGGDPLTLSTNYLQSMLQTICDIPHIKRIRIHSRLPVVLPQRIDQEFLSLIKDIPLQKIMVIHSNHPNEIDDDTGNAFKSLQENGVQVLNQTVLLKQINDQPHILAALSEKLFDYGVLPYYLHLLDKIQGAAAFEVSDEEAKKIMQQLITCLPGYLVPKLVREIPDKHSKTWIHF